MPRAFKKLDDDLPFSSINEESLPVKWAFVICMTMAHWKTGEFRVTPKKLAVLCGEGVDEDQARVALDVLTSPDPQSSSPELDGRRLEHLGNNDYRFVNWALYQGDMASIMEAERKKKEYWEKKGEDRRKPEKVGDSSISISTSNSTSKKVDSIKGGVGGKKKRVAVKPDYSDAFNAFWEQTWRRGNKKAAFAAWEAIEDEDMNAIVVAAGRWKVAFARREGGYVPHVSTWLNARGWEDDLDAELAKAKGDERQVGKTAPKPTVDQEAAKKRRNRVRQAILKHVIHLKDIEFDEPEVAAIVSGAVDKLNALSVLECESEDARELVEGFQEICDEMLLRIAKGWDPALREEWKKAALENGRTKDAQHRMYNALARRAVRVELGIKDVTDYDWVG